MSTQDIIDEFFGKFFPDLSYKVHKEQAEWLTTAIEEARKEEREKIVEWYKSKIESDGCFTSEPSGKEVIAYLTNHD